MDLGANVITIRAPATAVGEPVSAETIVATRTA
jgi:hypothetical protein